MMDFALKIMDFCIYNPERVEERVEKPTQVTLTLLMKRKSSSQRACHGNYVCANVDREGTVAAEEPHSGSPRPACRRPEKKPTYGINELKANRVQTGVNHTFIVPFSNKKGENP